LGLPPNYSIAFTGALATRCQAVEAFLSPHNRLAPDGYEVPFVPGTIELLS